MLGLLLCNPFISKHSFAEAGDTVKIQTFTFGNSQNDWFLFPPDTTSYSKILMYYTLKCNPAQNPKCGEWDYLTYSYLYDHTGVMDSNLLSHPNYIVNSGTPDSLKFMNQTAWSYFTYWQYGMVLIDTLSFDSAVVGAGVINVDQPFGAADPDSRSQYLWQSSELTASGLTAGDITGLRFNVQALGSNMQYLTIRMKHTSQDSLSSGFQNNGFTTVYSANTQFSSLGWHVFHFTQPFTWIDSLNIVVEICFDNSENGITNTVFGDNTPFPSGLYSSGMDEVLEFYGSDQIDIPSSAFTNIDSFITIAFWQYGDLTIQPQNDIIFEGVNSAGNRVINVHLPWGNKDVYWDAGNDAGSYDRINKTAADSMYEGKWNHWAFTKDVSTGTMQIFLNGILFHSGSGKTRDMSGITTFKIGSSGSSSSFYDGMIDEFSIWNTVLGASAIAELMYQDIAGTHPNYPNLTAYYQFNEGTGAIAIDSSGNGHHGSLLGMPQRMDLNICSQYRNITNTTLRPNVVFEKGTYNSYIDSILVTDSTEMTQISIVLYSDTSNPTQATDTLYKWPQFYNNYVYDSLGVATDSTLVNADSIMYRVDMNYYSAPFEIIDRYEIGRYITPYGNGLDLGEGFTWIYDVSDYVTLLHDSVHLSAGNWQELLSVKFIMIEGTPPRNVLKVDNLWNGSYGLSTFDVTVLPKTVDFDASASMFRFKARTSGHGWNNPTNCAEFCQKWHSITVDGDTKFNWKLWDECAFNPVFPQGGTWLIDRAGWCPGKDVRTYDYELTPYVTPGTSSEIDYNCQYDQYGNYVLATQLISYGPANFTLDVAMEDIITPSKNDLHSRLNPICSNPVIIIKNTGKTLLNSVGITYGVDGGDSCYFVWTGNLYFLDTTMITLPLFNWNGYSSKQVFYVKLSGPNGAADEYAPNNTMTSHFDIPPKFPYEFFLWLNTNNAANETSYELKDVHGTVLYSRNAMTNNTTYRDTFTLGSGCYELKISDSDDDGIAWWANSDGTGSARLKEVNGPVFKNFEADFGKEIAVQFTVDFDLGFGTPQDGCFPYGIHPDNSSVRNGISVYPNPSTGIISVDIGLNDKQDIDVKVYDVLGHLVYRETKKQTHQKHMQVDLSGSPAGFYVIHVVTDKKTISERILLIAPK